MVFDSPEPATTPLNVPRTGSSTAPYSVMVMEQLAWPWRVLDVDRAVVPAPERSEAGPAILQLRLVEAVGGHRCEDFGMTEAEEKRRPGSTTHRGGWAVTGGDPARKATSPRL